MQLRVGESGSEFFEARERGLLGGAIAAAELDGLSFEKDLGARARVVTKR